MRREWNHNEIILCDPATAVVLSAVIGAGSASVAANKAEDTAKKERARLAKAEEESKIEAERIARETRPEGETIEGISFGAGDDDELGSVGDFLVEKKPAVTTLGGTSGSGLGFSV